MADLTIYNIHTHFFTSSAVPRCFLPLHSLSLLCRQPFTNRIARILNSLCPYSSDDLLERYGRFTSIGNRSSQEEIFKLISGLYPYGTRFAVLTMDMAFMGAGPVRQDLPQQVEELGRLTRKYPDRIIPFVAVDPRRPDRLDIVKYGCDEFGFRGIKIYPALGFLPYDTRLEAVYRYCIDHGLQVFTHASPNGIHYRGKVTPEMVAGSRIPSHFADSCSLSPWQFFSHPTHYRVLCRDFPELKINLAHFGGGREWNNYLNESWFIDHPGENRESTNWFSIVLDLLRTEKNVYTDVANTMADSRYFSLLRVLLREPGVREKILFGSDFYMSQRDCPERRFALDLRGYLGEDDFRLIAQENPKRFLGLERKGG